MSKESIGYTLKKYREMNNISVKDVANKLDKSIKTIYAWENGMGQPDVEALITLCRMYNIEDFEVFSEVPDVNKKHFVVSPEQKNLLKKYDNLDDHGKEIVDFILTKEYERSQPQQKNPPVVYYNQTISPHMIASQDVPKTTYYVSETVDDKNDNL